MDLSVTLMVLGILVLCATVILIQQRSIDALTSKLMAKDYNEYKRNREPFQDTRDAPKPRKPMSFHDDPNIEIEDDSLN